MSKLERLKATRAAHRGVVSKLEKETHQLLPQDDSTSKRNRLDVISSLLENKLKTLDGLDNEINSLCPLEDITKEIEESKEIVAQIFDCQKQIEQLRKSVESPQVPPVFVPPSAVNVQTNQHSTMASNSVKPRLPKLSLPKFRGDVTKWHSFGDSFKSAIHENSDISTIDKFNYLNSLLEGKAARTVQGLKLTSSNYNAAVEMLQEHYGKPQIYNQASFTTSQIRRTGNCTVAGKFVLC